MISSDKAYDELWGSLPSVKGRNAHSTSQFKSSLAFLRIFKEWIEMRDFMKEIHWI